MTAFRLEWVPEYLKRSPSVIVDAGTYNGEDAMLFKQVFSLARVFAFEACPDNFSVLKRKGVVQASGVHAYHYAVCDHEDGVDFHSNTDTNQVAHFGQSGSILAPTKALTDKWPSITFKTARRVPSVRLDLFCQRHGVALIDILHMDVQGAEYFALVGLGEMRPPLIFLEINETKEVGRYENAVPENDIKGWFQRNGYVRKWESEFDALYVLA